MRKPVPSPRASHYPPAHIFTRSTAIASSSTLSAVIHPTPPFPFELALHYLRTSASAVVEEIDERGYARAVRLLGSAAVLVVSAAEGEGTPALRVQIEGTGLGAEHLEAAVHLARRVFATDADPSALVRDVAGDPVFAAVAQRFHGLRPVLIADTFETIVWAIIGQQINVVFAAKLKRALVEQYGERVSAGGRELLLFPRPEVLAGLDHERDLRPLQFSRQKSAYTIAVARAVANGELDLDALRDLPAEDAIARLTGIKGVGRWTAEYVLMRGLGHPDVLPAGDGGLKRAIGDAYGLGRLATEAEVRALAEGWKPWRSYAAFYWWFTLQLEAEAKRTRTAVDKARAGRRGSDDGRALDDRDT